MTIIRKAGFAGLGLIGGSIAKAIRRYYPDCRIVAFDQDQEALSLAMQEGIIQVSCSSIDENFRDCDFIFLCMPIACNNACLSRIRSFLSKDCILTDAGSVKTCIHEEVHRLGLQDFFIGGHPMAGSEKSGYGNSKAHLLENAYYILTPSETVPAEKTARYLELVRAIRALPFILDCRQHDHITAAISHLPHIIAASLVNYIRDADTKDELMKTMAAGGFKDITRIASSSPVMWQQICLKNQEQISSILGGYIKMLETAKTYIDGGDGSALYRMFETSRDYRNSMPEGSAGPIKKMHAVYCDIIDEAGGIATIATILASNNINIKNIGIIHNREFEEGVLRIEFYEESASEKAASLLRRYRYTVYER